MQVAEPIQIDNTVSEPTTNCEVSTFGSGLNAAAAAPTNTANASDTNGDVHPIYCNDPRKLHALLRCRVTVTTKNRRTYTGWVQTIDPVSESVVLVSLDTDHSTVVSATLVPGYNITGIRRHSDQLSPSAAALIDALFRYKQEQYSKGEVSKRRDALCVWLKDNRVPYTMNEGNTLQVLQFASIRPPYVPESITCTNEIVLDKILKLLQECPGFVAKPAC